MPFETTRWSLVVAAGSDDTAAARAALAALCETYWYPLYAYVRRRGTSPDDARDLTQGFLMSLLERRDFEHLRQERGRFRAFLLASLQHFLANDAARRRTQKRGGGAVRVTLQPDLTTGVGHGATAEQLSQLSDALDELIAFEPSLAELVELRFFCGYSFAEIAQIRGVSERTVHRDWRKARVLLYHTLLAEDAPPPA